MLTSKLILYLLIFSGLYQITWVPKKDYSFLRYWNVIKHLKTNVLCTSIFGWNRTYFVIVGSRHYDKYLYWTGSALLKGVDNTLLDK